MEDQPTDSGDLTTDAAASAPTPRGRHRMPSGKKMRTLKSEDAPAAAEPEEPVVDKAQEPVVEDSDATVEAATPEAEHVPAAPVKKSRRWNILRRHNSEPEVATSGKASAPEAPPESEPNADFEPTSEAESDASPQVEDDTAEGAAATDLPEPAEGVAAEIAETTESDATDAEQDEPEPVLVPHRPAGKRLKIAAAAAAALFVAGGAFLGATAQPVIANRALVETKLNIARTAANAITTLWSYTPENMDTLGERSARYLSGDFASQYKKFIDSIVATNKQAQVTNTTSVLGTAVESVSATDASAIVYTNSTATSPVSKNIPSLRYLSYRLEMKRDDSDWRITRMTTVTALDLTPQL